MKSLTKQNTSQNSKNTTQSQISDETFLDMLNELLEIFDDGAQKDKKQDKKQSDLKVPSNSPNILPEKTTKDELFSRPLQPTNKKDVKESKKMKDYKLDSKPYYRTPIIDLKNNIIKYLNNEYTVYKFYSETGMPIHNLVKPCLNVESPIQFLKDSKMFSKDAQYYLLSDDVILTYDYTDISHSILTEMKIYITKIYRDGLKPYLKYFKTKFDEDTHKLHDLLQMLKLDYSVEAVPYYTIELKPKFETREDGRAIILGDVDLEFIDDLKFEEIVPVFKKFIELDRKYLAECAFTGEFLKIYFTNENFTKKIFNKK